MFTHRLHREGFSMTLHLWLHYKRLKEETKPEMLEDSALVCPVSRAFTSLYRSVSSPPSAFFMSSEAEKVGQRREWGVCFFFFFFKECSLHGLYVQYGCKEIVCSRSFSFRHT